MEESILKTIRKLIGLDPETESFDLDLMVAINTAFTILTRMGVGPDKGFKINGIEETWSDFTNDEAYMESVKTYIHLKTKMLFDPPTNSTVIESYNSAMKELEWTLYNESDMRRG